MSGSWRHLQPYVCRIVVGRCNWIPLRSANKHSNYNEFLLVCPLPWVMAETLLRGMRSLNSAGELGLIAGLLTDVVSLLADAIPC